MIFVIVLYMLNNKYVDVFGSNPSNSGTMQVIVFDKFFKCIYRLWNIPKDWHFDKIAKLLELNHAPNEYQAIRLMNTDELCIDDYVYNNDKLLLTSTNYD